MNGSLDYYTLKEPVRARFSRSGSRFISTLAPVETTEGARAQIEAVQAEFADATHHAYAYRIGAGPSLLERSSDDREPAGSAGPPMLQAMQGAELSDAVVVGTRYFGGVKLGIGGLTRAYRDCVRQGLMLAELLLREPFVRYRVDLSYSDLGPASRFIERRGGVILSMDFSSRTAVAVSVPERLAADFCRGLTDVVRGNIDIQKMAPPGAGEEQPE